VTLRRTILGLALVGCGPRIDMDPAGEDGSTGASTSPGPITSPTTSSTSSVTTATTIPPDPSTTTDDSTSSDDGATFLVPPGTTSVTCLSACECDVIDQDCMPGEKCAPWANDGGDFWNANRCTAIDPEGGAPGEPCTVEGSGVSGVDDCDATSFCFNVDPTTLQGVCVPFCEGTEADPLCPRGTQCMHSNEGTIAVCLPTCDPLASTCGEGEGCYLVGEVFHCLRVGAPVDDHGAPVAYCDPGSIAVSPRSLSSCDPEGELCCAQLCDVDQPACAPPSQCISLWEKGGNPGLCLD
jgi:hypothetical protein